MDTSDTQKTPAIIAIDPGLAGAWAALRLSDGGFLTADELPRFSKLLDARALVVAINEYNVRQVIIERVHSMPKQGVASSFAFGCAYGVTIGVAAGAGYPVSYVTPQKWKSHFRLYGKDKEASRERALQLYPSAYNSLKLKKHHGRAEAILMARYFFDLTTAGEFV